MHIANTSDDPPDVAALAMLHRAGWSNGENLLRVEGPTRDSAWLAAVAEARALGTLDRSWGLS